jgi:hypothetical protein
MPLNYSALGFGELDNKLLQDAQNAIDALDLWDWLKYQNSIGPNGFSTFMCNEVDCIGHAMKCIHTKESFNRIMDEMYHLATMGIDTYCSCHAPTVFTSSVAPKEIIERTPDMDKKVIDEYKNRAPFKSAPKWSRDYISAHPDVLRNLSTEFEKM